MCVLQQGRSVFTPLPLKQHQDPSHISRFQEIAKNAQEKLTAISGPLFNQSNALGNQKKLRDLINLLNVQKNLGLGWDLDLKKETSEYWKERAELSKFLEFLLCLMSYPLASR